MPPFTKRRIGIAISVLLLAAIAGWFVWSARADRPEYKTAKLERGDIVASVSASGTLNPVVSVQVGSQVSGQIKEIHVDFNSEVKQGQLIARLDPETFEYRVRQAQADLEAARAQALTQQSQVAAQRAQAAQTAVNASNTKRDLARKEDLMEKGFISGAERDNVRASYLALEEQVKAAEAQVKVAQSNALGALAAVKQREAALAQARIDLERTSIRAPVNGVVIKRSIEKGQTVAASLQSPELFIIAENLTDMRVDTAIDESEIGRILPGQKATFTVDAFPGRVFDGTVKQIRKAAQNVSNVVTYMVEVSASNPGGELLPGMTANVRVVTDTRKDVLKVPNAALRFRPPGASRANEDSRANRAEQSAQPAQGNGSGRGQGQGGNAMRERLEKELQLTAEQKTKIDAIYAASREKMSAAREAAPEERRKQMELNRAEQREQIRELLNPEQRKQYEAILAEGRPGAASYAPGRVYVPDGGDVRELALKTGLTDGRMTEVTGEGLTEGMEVVTGIVQQQSAPASGGARTQGPRMF